MKTLNQPFTQPPHNEQELFEPLRKPTGNQKRKILIFFLGGITFAEISAIRFLNKQFSDKQFIIATTSIISAEKVIKQMDPVLENSLDRASVFAEDKSKK